MKRYSIFILAMVALFCVPALGQDIILLNQDGEKVGVAKDVDKKATVDAVGEFKLDKGAAKIKNGVITVVNADGTTQEFKMSDARSVTITRSSKSVVGEDGQQKKQTTGKAILIGPDGVRREINLGDGGIGRSMTESKMPKTWMIGVSCMPASPVLRSQLQLEEEMGLVITRVLQGGAAENAGFQQNDIVMFADQKPVGSRKDLSKIVNEAGAAGNDVTFTLLRSGEEISAIVTPTEREGVNQMMIELGPGFDGLGTGLPSFGPGIDFEFKQFGPGIIIGRGDVDGAMLGDGEIPQGFESIEEKMTRIQEEVEEMRRRMREGK